MGNVSIGDPQAALVCAGFRSGASAVQSEKTLFQVISTLGKGRPGGHVSSVGFVIIG